MLSNSSGIVLRVVLSQITYIRGLLEILKPDDVKIILEGHGVIRFWGGYAAGYFRMTSASW